MRDSGRGDDAIEEACLAIFAACELTIQRRSPSPEPAVIVIATQVASNALDRTLEVALAIYW
eukprot:CAMPEP_0114131430 /NCGR_PEP_ID=MMETSP0043_2-20121206/12549_1 /TAXON_ID=464988 /ORGANISM="Hemiselmis andersenii, Strain CCMP644" /LENGTH=61 /DNA_ID=CAMNT_0001224861 /DNA_START=132 /DNA_END=314 /DNA_ORIENTATION=+